MPYLGETCALLAAICWTASGTAFAVASRATTPRAANQYRLYAALPVLLLVAWLVEGSPWPNGIDASRAWALAGSAFAGLVLGDLGYFHSLATIGPRLSSVVYAAWPGMTVGLEAMRGQAPAADTLLGIAITMVGVGVVLLRSRDGSAWQPGLTRREWWSGLGGALLGAAGQAVGFVLAGIAMGGDAALPSGVSPLHATLWRMVVGLLGLQAYLWLRGEPFAMRAVRRAPRALAAARLGALCGPIAGVWLSMIARHHASDAGVASALLATTPIFMMPVAALLYGARIGWLGALGTVMATAGVALCFGAAPGRVE